jgi:hypothetical protein
MQINCAPGPPDVWYNLQEECVWGGGGRYRMNHYSATRMTNEGKISERVRKQDEPGHVDS